MDMKMRLEALPYFLDKFDVPVFGSELTISLAKWYVEEAGLDIQFDDYHAIDEEVEIDFDGTVVRFSARHIQFQIQWGLQFVQMKETLFIQEFQV